MTSFQLAFQQVQVCKGSKIPRNSVFHTYYNRRKSKSQALLCTMRGRDGATCHRGIVDGLKLEKVIR